MSTTFTPTPEQQAAIDLFHTGRSLAIEALAGSGKSSTLRLIANSLAPRPGRAFDRVVLTAFNRSVINDARASMPRHINVRSNHSLAWGIGRVYQDAGRLEGRLTPRVLAQHAGWTARTFGSLSVEDGAHLALSAVLRYQMSADKVLGLKHVDVPKDDDGTLADAVLRAANQAWDLIANPRSTLPATHDSYLKLWALTEPQIPADVIMLDEAQDANPLIVDVLSRQRAQVVIVGDRYQQIYSWRGATNAMSNFPVQERCWLTQSFRFGPAIAEAANEVLANHLNAPIRVRGNPAVASRLAPGDGSVLLARTNVALVGEVLAAHAAGIPNIAVIGGVSDLIKLVDGAALLSRGERAPKVPELMDFGSWGEVRDYAKTPAGSELSVLVRLVEEYGTDALTGALRAIEGNESQLTTAGRVLCTAHKSKGLEWENVTLLNDFRVPSDADLGLVEDRAQLTPWSAEDGNLLYVAATRGKVVLDDSQCSALHDAARRGALRQSEPARAPCAADGVDSSAPPPTAAHADATGGEITDRIEYLIEQIARRGTPTLSGIDLRSPDSRDSDPAALVELARDLHAAFTQARIAHLKDAPHPCPA